MTVDQTSVFKTTAIYKKVKSQTTTIHGIHRHTLTYNQLHSTSTRHILHVVDTVAVSLYFLMLCTVYTLPNVDMYILTVYSDTNPENLLLL